MKLAGFPHSDTAGSKDFGSYPASIVRLARPSSVSYTKASTVCVCKDFLRPFSSDVKEQTLIVND